MTQKRLDARKDESDHSAPVVTVGYKFANKTVLINAGWLKKLKRKLFWSKFMFWRRNKELANEVSSLEEKIRFIEADIRHESARLTIFSRILSLIPSVPNSGFFMVYEHNKTEEKEKEWIAKGWHLKDKSEHLEVWVKD